MLSLNVMKAEFIKIFKTYSGQQHENKMVINLYLRVNGAEFG